MTWKLAIALGVTAFLVVFATVSWSEDQPFETAFEAAVIAGVVGGGLVLLWGWAVG